MSPENRTAPDSAGAANGAKETSSDSVAGDDLEVQVKCAPKDYTWSEIVSKTADLYSIAEYSDASLPTADLVAEKFEVSADEAKQCMAEAEDVIQRKALRDKFGVFIKKSDTGGKKTRRQFVAPNLARLLTAETPVATGADGSLFVYKDGYYQRDAERPLSARIKWVLHEDWAERKEHETFAYLRSSPRLALTPPASRINLRNGVLDLDTGRLGPHSPDELSPVQLPVAYDEKAKAPNIAKFVAEVLPDPEDQSLFYEIVGYTLVPDNSLQKAFMFIGSGANGKSTALSLIEALLGEHNISHVSLQQLTDDRFAAARLDGKLANIFADLDHRALASSSKFKAITGGDTIPAERKFREPFDLRPYARLLFSANEAPPSPDSSVALRRRWIVLPFGERFSAERADPALSEKLTTPDELSGFLNLALRGLRELRERGRFRDTEASKAAAEKYHEDTDSVAGFLAEEVAFTSDTFEKGQAIYDEYVDWCRRAGRHPVKRNKLYDRLKDDHPELRWTKRQGDRGFVGIRLLRRDRDAAAGGLPVAA